MKGKRKLEKGLRGGGEGFRGKDEQRGSVGEDQTKKKEDYIYVEKKQKRENDK